MCTNAVTYKKPGVIYFKIGIRLFYFDGFPKGPKQVNPPFSMTALLELLKDADPEMKAKLRLALLT